MSLSGDAPDDLPVVLNALIHAYLTDVTNKERLKQPARLEQLSDKYRQLSESLRQKRVVS